MIDLTNKKMLETKFAEDFATPLYPILADIYLLEGDLDRARKVCEVGLDYDSTNVDGKYILGKVAIAENKLTVAEKWLKQVCAENPAHFSALRLLIKIKIKLNRSAKTIQVYIDYLLQFIPYDEECMNWLNAINISENAQNKKNIPDLESLTKHTGQQSTSKQTTEQIAVDDYEIVESMATFTMAKVLKSQKYFHQALSVLEVLQSNGENSEQISSEKAEIQQLIQDTTK